MSFSRACEVPLFNTIDSWDQNHSQLVQTAGNLQGAFLPPWNLGDTAVLRIEQMAHTVANHSRLFAYLDASRAPRLRDLDIQIHGTRFISDHQSRVAYYSESVVNLRQAAWQAWFAQHIHAESTAILPTRRLSLSDQYYSGSIREASAYRVLLPLLARVPQLQRLDLTLEMDYLPTVDIDLETALPHFSELGELTIGNMILPVFKAMMAKMGPRFETLNIFGCLSPNRQDGDPLIVEGYEDPGERASVSAASQMSTPNGHLRPVEILDMVRDLSSLGTSSSTSGEPVRIKRLRITTWLHMPRHKKHTMRIAQAASFIRGMPLLERLHTLELDRPTFSALCGFAHLYLSSNPLPSAIRFFTLFLRVQFVEDVETDLFGKQCTRVDQAFEVLRLQIERGEAPMLRRVTVGFGQWVVIGDEEYKWATEDQLLPAEFRATCHRRRIEVHFGVQDELLSRLVASY